MSSVLIRCILCWLHDLVGSCRAFVFYDDCLVQSIGVFSAGDGSYHCTVPEGPVTVPHIELEAVQVFAELDHFGAGVENVTG